VCSPLDIVGQMRFYSVVTPLRSVGSNAK